MKIFALAITSVIFAASAALATQADNTNISVISHQPGATPFISNFAIQTSDTHALKNIQYTIRPTPGSVVRPLSATYTAPYLEARGFLKPVLGQITLPVWGLYGGSTNTVRVRFVFQDSSFKEQIVTVVTDPFVDTCPLGNPTVEQARTGSTKLSYDYMLVTSSCSQYSPTIIDTDGRRRWVGTAGVQNNAATFFDNAVYLADGPRLLRIEMDGAVTVIRDYTSAGVHAIHDTIDKGKNGLILEVDTQDYIASVLIEVDPRDGHILNKWDFANIISNAITAGGGDPSTFVRKVQNGDYSSASPSDWFHNDAHWYRSADNTLIVSSRENFVIAVDYQTKAIKWIFGDQTKAWYVNFPSLRPFALAAINGPAPAGQHATSITADDHLLLFDNGEQSLHQTPAGVERPFSAARKYAFNLQAKEMTQVQAFTNNNSVKSPFCSSVYEDAPENYLVAYGDINGNTAEILGLTPAGEKVFDYQYPSGVCDVAYRAKPLRFEAITFAPTDIHLANISTRLFVGTGNKVAIAGFIVTGAEPGDGNPGNDIKSVVVRGLGPSLPLGAQRLADPTLALYNSAGKLIEFNNSWTTSKNRDRIEKSGLQPSNNSEAAIAATLAPGAYTAVLAGANATSGIGLVEVYDINLRASAKLANLSTRGAVGTGDQVLIGGIIVQGDNIKRLLFRALGPQLADSGLKDTLKNPTLSLFDANGNKFDENDDWQTQSNAGEISRTGVAPKHPLESAILIPLPPGAYTGIISGKNGSTGTGLFEVYQLD